MTDPKPATESKRQMNFAILEDGSIQATFGQGVDPLTLDLASIPEKIQLAAITEGLISRARAYCSALEGDDRTPAALRERTALAFANLQAGMWKVERSAGGGVEVTIEVEAAWLFRKMRADSKGEPFSETIGETALAWADLSEEKQKQVKGLPRYQQALAQVKAQRMAAKAEKLAKKAAEDEGENSF